MHKKYRKLHTMYILNNLIFNRFTTLKKKTLQTLQTLQTNHELKIIK